MFHFKQFSLSDDRTAMKVGTDAVLLGSWVAINQVNSILDVGTGSGILALMMAQRFLTWIDAVEIDAATAEEASQNFALSPWTDLLHIHAAPFQDFATHENLSYDLIISNPPFFTNALKPPEQERCKARHDDLLPVDELLYGVNQLLSDSGKLAIIIPFESGNTWTKKASIFGLVPTRRATVIPRQGKPSSRLMLEFQRFPGSLIQDETILIRNLDGSYSDQYKKLTSDFYLGL
jgi:tRNA1Val (adenine37-N6)-methyltransferase